MDSALGEPVIGPRHKRVHARLRRAIARTRWLGRNDGAVSGTGSTQFDASATMLMELANSGVRFCGFSVLAYGSHALLNRGRHLEALIWRSRCGARVSVVTQAEARVVSGHRPHRRKTGLPSMAGRGRTEGQ